LIGREIPDHFGHRRHERIGIRAAAYEHSTATQFLIEGVIHGQLSRRLDRFVLDIGDDADNAAWLITDPNELRSLIGPGELTTDWILSREELRGQRRADDDHALGAIAIGI